MICYVGNDGIYEHEIIPDSCLLRLSPAECKTLSNLIEGKEVKSKEELKFFECLQVTLKDFYDD